MNKQKKIISHRFLNKHTVLGAILLTAFGMLFSEGVFGSLIGLALSMAFSSRDVVSYGMIPGALLVLAIHKRWFYPEFEGNLRGGKVPEPESSMDPFFGPQTAIRRNSAGKRDVPLRQLPTYSIGSFRIHERFSAEPFDQRRHPVRIPLISVSDELCCPDCRAVRHVPRLSQNIAIPAGSIAGASRHDPEKAARMIRAKIFIDHIQLIPVPGNKESGIDPLTHRRRAALYCLKQLPRFTDSALLVLRL